MTTTCAPLTRPWAPTGGTRSEHTAHASSGAVLIAYRRQARRGWLWAAWRGTGRAGHSAEGRAPTLAAAQGAAEAAAARMGA